MPSLACLRADVLSMYGAAVEAVNGTRCVARALQQSPPRRPVHLLAIGKAAAAMTAGAAAVLGRQLQRGLLVTASGHLDSRLAADRRLVCLEAAHPVPDARSLAAGKAVTDFLTGVPAHAEILVLVSGGASSLVEVLPDGIDLATLQRLNRWLLASGQPIDTVNRIRQSVSRIKGGRLRAWLGEQPVTVLLISDVAGDDPAVIGSGLLLDGAGAIHEPAALPGWLVEVLRAAVPAQPIKRAAAVIRHRIVASLNDALQAAAARARSLDYQTRLHGARLAGDALQTGRGIVARLRRRPAGVWLAGGETTVRLPARPGQGGRNQSLALSAALELAPGDAIVLLAAGTDGIDGNSRAAGALIDAGTIARGTAAGLDARHCLRHADAGRFLAASGDLINTGPTGTNVADLVIAITGHAGDAPGRKREAA
jgi:hydroxypyruvate reductase